MRTILIPLLFLTAFNAYGEDKIKLKTTTIKGNTELPKILYVVPWQDVTETSQGQNHQKLTLHSLFGDLFDPIPPVEPEAMENKK